MIKKLLLAFIVFALGLQGFAAVAMPFCQHQPSAIHQVMEQDSEQHAHHGSVADAEGSAAAGSFACDDCAFCQLCAAPAIPAVALILLPEAAPSLITTPPVYLSLFVPEQPQPPPVS